jgi:hypothetical protein
MGREIAKAMEGERTVRAVQVHDLELHCVGVERDLAMLSATQKRDCPRHQRAVAVEVSTHFKYRPQVGRNIAVRGL